MSGREKAAAKRAPFPAAGCSSSKASRYGDAASILKPIPAHESALLEAGGYGAYREGMLCGQRGNGFWVIVPQRPTIEGRVRQKNGGHSIFRLELTSNVAILWLPLMAQGIISMKKFALIALPFALAACSQSKETTVEPTATETAMVEPMATDTAAPMATDTGAPMATDTATPAAGDTTAATPAATETPM